MSAQEEAAGVRLVSAEEARDWLEARAESKAAGVALHPTQVAEDFAHTVVVQAEQIAAVLALHTGRHVCDAVDREFCATTFADGESCPTARALGVTA